MKTMVSYVVHDAENHKHQSEILEITSHPYTFSPEPPISEVMKWAKRKQSELSKGQTLVVVSMFKI
jgi:hypothetical protein